MSLLIELPQYQHISANVTVRALKIAAIIPNPRGIELHFENARFAPIQVSNQWDRFWAPEPGGFYGHDETGEQVYLHAESIQDYYTMIEVGA